MVQKSKNQDRNAKLKSALRNNLQKRKAQTRRLEEDLTDNNVALRKRELSAKKDEKS